jgi:bifunctional N-acetylglucosamine-1-phosphate-uridyltransferase/glucosamine-1-phosphate-acetyltransferase GlmU-like protein
MNSSPSLVILAGGMGSRYQGAKQIDLLGEQHAFLLEFAIYDAIEAGFEQVILIVNERVLLEMQSKLIQWESRIEVVFVLQELSSEQQQLVNPERSKPWGTAHALLCAKPYLSGSFVVMNADDYYGQTVMKTAHSFFLNETHAHGLVSYALADTLSEYGGVSRGLCHTNEQGFLKSIVECHGIFRDLSGLHSQEEISLSENDRVSMNLWLFQRSILDFLPYFFDAFLQENKDHLTAECYLPNLVQSGIDEHVLTVKVLSSHEQWVGLTFKEDKENVQQFIHLLTDKKYYPKSFTHE